MDEYEAFFEAPVSYLPQCGDDRPTQDTGRHIDADCVFVGGVEHPLYHKNRMGIISSLQNLVVGVAIVTGEGYSRDTKYLYSTAPFALSISPQIEGYTSNRLYNILASSGFCLSLYFPGIEDLFENHKHLCWFKTPEEAKKIIDYYYEHPEEYEAVRKNGNALYKERHTAKKRLEHILETICS